MLGEEARWRLAPVLQYDRLLREPREAVAALQPNFHVSFACGHYFGPKFLAIFPAGTANIHLAVTVAPWLFPPAITLLTATCTPASAFSGLSRNRQRGILAPKNPELEGTETTGLFQIVWP
jgi:methionyl-tRNA formyltransferase